MMSQEALTPGPQKELKVKLATRLHVQLHSRKILHGASIQDTIAAALDLYFRDHPTPTFADGIPDDSAS